MEDFTVRLLRSVDPALITCCAYHRDYLIRLQKDAAYYGRIYSHILGEAERALHGKPKEQAHLIDFGCGQGMLGFYAKLCGWDKVSLLDLNPHCIQNAEILAQALGLSNITCKVGTEEALKAYFSETGTPDVLISMDVIEHVYDLNRFFALLKEAAPDAPLILTTGAIAENPLRARPVMKLQIADENKGAEVLQTTPNNPYAGLSFKEVRRRMIKKADKENAIKEPELKKLVLATRGLNQNDIGSAVLVFLENGAYPPVLSHPTNTCDPVSSSWTEHLLTTAEYKQQFKESGYNVAITPGFYNTQTNKGIKKAVLLLLNFMLRMNRSPKMGAYILMSAQPE